MASCLSEEYTNKIKCIHLHLEEALDFYNNLPDCIRRNSNVLRNYNETLGVLLSKCAAAAEELKMIMELNKEICNE